MFDFEEITRKNTDKIIKKHNIDTDPIFTPRFRKFIKWFGYTFIPMMMGFASFIVLAKILFALKDRMGIDGVIVIGLIMIIFSLRKIGSQLGKLTS